MISNLGKAAAALCLASALPTARAALTYQNVNGTGVVYDSATHLYWLQDGNYSTTLTYAGAQTWISSLNVPGIGGGWQIPSVADLQSFEGQLTPTGNGYIGTLSFGPGANDHVLNIQPAYWTSDPGSAGNEYAVTQYGYQYPLPVTDTYNVWAVATVVPEPGTVGVGLLAMGLAGFGVVRRARKQA